MNKLKKKEHKCQRIGRYIINQDEIVGRGATATVFKGQTYDSKEAVAIKLIDFSQNCDTAQKSLLENQCKVLRLINHPNMLRLLDIIEQDNKFYIITKFYEGTTLAEHLQSHAISQQTIVSVFKKILEGIAYLIDKNIIHRDLKPANIIIDKNMNPIIIDFGFCEIIHEAKISRVFNVGSPSYMAPEAYLRTLYSQKSESWSLGMILYEMLHKRTLDKGINIKDFYETIRNVEGYIINQIDRSVAPQMKQLLQKAFKYNSMDRLSIVGMKYCIDLYLLNRKRQNSQKLIHAPSTTNFRPPKQIPKFDQQAANVINTHFQHVSPIKKRDVSVKFIHPQANKPPICFNRIAKQQQIPRLPIPSIDNNCKNTEYFSNKIKKGVFDIKRFSYTQRNALTPHLNTANLPSYPTQHKTIIKLM